MTVYLCKALITVADTQYIQHKYVIVAILLLFKTQLLQLLKMPLLERAKYSLS